ncbi:ribosomal protection-like ABC-F family protein [Bacillus sp. D386]|uniref:ribosomal protection-like ABC-F family protein n=1 Tax=Bacillus sp. D386 TaxID=2587155 RepID=UPI00111E074A|nr:ABC-F type ribosomal protection protein [Bacillus sp. D386]
MIVCSVQQIEKNYGGTKLFENITFEIKEGERVGFVGRNGCGKSTILKMIAGVETIDEGAIHIKKGAAIGLLSQIPDFTDGITVYECLQSAFSHMVELKERLDKLEHSMATDINESSLARSIEQYGEVQEQFERLGGYEMDSTIMKIANGLMLDLMLDKRFVSLSGGEKTKVCLGVLLLQKPDLLLLDEPTNHLDIGAVEWLEGFLEDYDGTVLIVSHDRFFLDRTVKRILDLDDGEIFVYEGNYSEFVQAKEKRLLEEFNQYKEQQKKIKKMKEAIKRLREWANQANPPSEGLHKRARNMERALERMEKIKRPILERRKMDLDFDLSERSGKDVLQLHGITKRFGTQTLFENMDLLVQYGERIAIVGANGTGKSTILKLVLNEFTPDVGEVKLGSNVKIGYLSQQLFQEGKDMTVLEAFRQEVHVTEGEARHILARFLFYGFQVFQKVEKLSGGERMRLRLAQLMYQDINLVILDEPTNHLDIDSREVLEEALSEFPGTIIVVSHDRYLLNKLFQKTYWLQNRTLQVYLGNYSWAREHMLADMLQVKQTSQSVTRSQSNVQLEHHVISKETYESLEKKIATVEHRLSEIIRDMEKEIALEALQLLYVEKKEAEEVREDLYEELDRLDCGE